MLVIATAGPAGGTKKVAPFELEYLAMYAKTLSQHIVYLSSLETKENKLHVK